MRDSSRRDWARALVIAAGLTFVAAVGAGADPIVTNETFGTTGTVGTDGVAGTPVVSFQGIDAGALTTGTPFDLGKFVVGTVPEGTSTTYTNTPFAITFQNHATDGGMPSNNGTPVILDGWLNGTVGSNSTSDLRVNFDVAAFNPEDGPPYPTTIRPFQTGSLINYLNLNQWGDNGQPIEAELNVTQAVPEPSTIVVFACIAGLIARRRYHADRLGG